MGSTTVTGPINTEQYLTAFSPTGCTILGEPAGSGPLTVTANMSDAQVAATVAGIVYDPTYQTTPAANAATLHQRALNALSANATYQAIAAPTNQQVVAQVALLTKECNGIIRLLLNQLDTTSGT